MIEIQLEGLSELSSMIERIGMMLSPAALEQKALALAAEAGQILLVASVRACIEAVYDHPNFPSLWDTTPSRPGSDAFGGNDAVRYNDLLDSIKHFPNGLEHFIGIDPDAVPTLPHQGRETVLRYAIPVHEGYTQWIYGRDTGIYHPGRFWFDAAAIEAGPVVAAFVLLAFSECVMEAIAA